MMTSISSFKNATFKTLIQEVLEVTRMIEAILHLSHEYIYDYKIGISIACRR